MPPRLWRIYIHIFTQLHSVSYTYIFSYFNRSSWDSASLSMFGIMATLCVTSPKPGDKCQELAKQRNRKVASARDPGSGTTSPLIIWNAESAQQDLLIIYCPLRIPPSHLYSMMRPGFSWHPGRRVMGPMKSVRPVPSMGVGPDLDGRLPIASGRLERRRSCAAGSLRSLHSLPLNISSI